MMHCFYMVRLIHFLMIFSDTTIFLVAKIYSINKRKLAKLIINFFNDQNNIVFGHYSSFDHTILLQIETSTILASDTPRINFLQRNLSHNFNPNSLTRKSNHLLKVDRDDHLWSLELRLTLRMCWNTNFIASLHWVHKMGNEEQI